MLADADHQLRNVAVSDDRLGHLEELQIRHHEGPCIAAFDDKEDDKELVGVEDLTEDARWPLFSAAAVDRGARAVLASKGMSARTAYEQLRAQARSQRRKLAAVSAEVVRDAAKGGRAFVSWPAPEVILDRPSRHRPESRGCP